MSIVKSPERSCFEILGAKVDRVNLPSAVAQIVDWVDHPSDRTRFVVATGFHGLWVGHQDPEFLSVLNSADLFCPDGIAPVWLSRLRGEPLPARVPGPSLMTALLEKADENGYDSFFYGDRQDTLETLHHHLETQYRGHRIAGMYSPPFRAMTRTEDEEIVRTINEAQPDILWVGLGLPKQEKWIHEHLDRLNVPVAIGVGAAFGFLSGKVRRAPQWIGNAGFEWAWRLAAEPRKLWRRDLIDGPLFLYHALLDHIRHKINSAKTT